MRLSGRETFDLDEMIEEVVRDANFEGAVKNCRVRAARRGEFRASIGNRELLRSAIENVLRNAVRYSPQDAQVDCVVDAHAEFRVGSILIRDRGPGVPAMRPGAHIRAVLPGRRVARPR